MRELLEAINDNVGSFVLLIVGLMLIMPNFKQK